MKRFQYPNLDEAVYRETLPCGLPVMVVPRPGFSRKLAYFATDFGSVHRDFTLEGKTYHAPQGIAHFLEHKMFDMPEGRDVSAELARLGAGSNAFTDYDMTAYYIGCTDNFYESLRLLLEFVSTPYFTEQTVSKEWGIIDQEIGMTLDDPGSRVFENLMAGLYRSHPVCETILGTPETIRQITPEILYACHRAFYTPENMILCVVGDVDPDRVAAIATEVLGTARKEPGRKIRQWNEPLTAYGVDPRQEMAVSMPTFQLGFKAEPVPNGYDGIRQEIVADLAAEALFGESSPVYLKLYEQGLIDSSFGGGFETIDGMAMLLCSGDSDDPEAIREEILRQGEQIAAAGIPEDAFQRMKRSAMGRRIRDLDSFDATCFRLISYYFSDFDYFRFPDIYRDITVRELQEFLGRIVRRERCGLSVIDPISQEA